MDGFYTVDNGYVSKKEVIKAIQDFKKSYINLSNIFKRTAFWIDDEDTGSEMYDIYNWWCDTQLGEDFIDMDLDYLCNVLLNTINKV